MFYFLQFICSVSWWYHVKILSRSKHTWMTRYRWGSRAILQNSAASSLNFGLLSASIIQPREEKNCAFQINLQQQIYSILKGLQTFKRRCKYRKVFFQFTFLLVGAAVNTTNSEGDVRSQVVTQLSLEQTELLRDPPCEAFHSQDALKEVWVGSITPPGGQQATSDSFISRYFKIST